MIHFVVALRAEAAPLLRHYDLRATEDSIAGFPIFRSDRHALVVAGVGKTRAAAGTALLRDRARSSRADVWLNVGIAGHRDKRVGALVRAHTVVDEATGKRFFPARLGGPALDRAVVRTVDRPEDAFATDDVYEMEASGFVDTAVRFSTIELVQCLKIVSDNRATGTEDITRDFVRGLVEAHLESIDALAAHLGDLAQSVAAAPPAPMDELIGERRFTTTQRRRLTALLRRCHAFGAAPRPEEWRSCRTAQALLDGLEARLRARALESESYE